MTAVHRASRLAIAALVALAPAGCVSHYSDGPRFAAISRPPPPGHGLVYLYRPPRSFGAAYLFDVTWKSRVVTIVSGSYAAWILPVGTQTLVGAEPITVEVREGSPTFVRYEFGSTDRIETTSVVPATQAADEIEDCHLALGGRARWPIAEIELPPKEPNP